MTASSTPESSKPAIELPTWIADHLKQYLETDGAQGHMWNGVPCLLLTTTGRKSGKSLQLPLIYGKSGSSYLIVASKGGAETHPAWYVNLAANPDITLQVGADRFAARARTATDAEKPALWAIMAKIWPAYNEYQAKTGRPIPVVVMDRV